MSEITKLKRRAAAFYAVVRVFRRDYRRADGRPIKYELCNPYNRVFASSLAELRKRVQRAEAQFCSLPPEAREGLRRAHARWRGSA